jgi:hypothetical protein
MNLIWIPFLAIGGLVLLFRLQKAKVANEDPTEAGCGLGCCGCGEHPPDRERGLKSPATNKCH